MLSRTPSTRRRGDGGSASGFYTTFARQSRTPAAFQLEVHGRLLARLALAGLKDRHNGNILLDNKGHVIHIDFGFLLGTAPGGSFSLERVPFKLTAEHVEAMGGWQSDGFADFVVLLCCAFSSLQKHRPKYLGLVEVRAAGLAVPLLQDGDRGGREDAESRNCISDERAGRGARRGSRGAVAQLRAARGSTTSPVPRRTVCGTIDVDVSV